MYRASHVWVRSASPVCHNFSVSGNLGVAFSFRCHLKNEQGSIWLSHCSLSSSVASSWEARGWICISLPRGVLLELPHQAQPCLLLSCGRMHPATHFLLAPQGSLFPGFKLLVQARCDAVRLYSLLLRRQR
jgi:hypothetical protein